MCRMIAIFPTKWNPESTADILTQFRLLALNGKVKPRSKPGHRDGWGLVTWARGVPIYLAREATDAYSDVKYLETMKAIGSTKADSPFIAHFRKKSVGVIDKDNTHPFIAGKWAFAHNGTIRRLNLKTTTDSEWFFREFMESNGGSFDIDALRDQIRRVRTSFPYTSITFLLSDGRDLFAYRDFAKKSDSGYYTLYYATLPDSIVICQEKIIEANWHELSNGEMLHIKPGGKLETIENFATSENLPKAFVH
jgi:predicted glutamine amidotransferase